jgi:hypothetical protein
MPGFRTSQREASNLWETENMNRNAILFLVAGGGALALGLSPAWLLAGGDTEADHEEKIVVALKTDGFELEETDLSDLAVGDAHTIHTGSGKTVDLLRTEDGIEVYVDGELMTSHGGDHSQHRIVHKHVEIVCDDTGECEDVDLAVLEEVELEMHGEHEGHRVFVIEKNADEI